MDGLQDLRVQLSGRVHHPRPSPAGGADRHVRRGRAADHREERAGIRRRVQAGGCQAAGRQLYPQDEALRIRGKDDHSLPEKGMAYL